MRKAQVCHELDLTVKQLEWLEYNYLKTNKEHVRACSGPVYPAWYVTNLKQWKIKYHNQLQSIKNPQD